MTATEPTTRATIRDVARAAGVSHQTVSRFLRYDGAGMKAATLERIRAAVADLDYRPSLVAQAMRGRRTGRLALVLPSGNAVSSLEVLNGATDAAREQGYDVEVVLLGGGDSDRHNRLRAIAESTLFEGVLCLTPIPAETVASALVPLIVSPDYDAEMRSIGTLAEGSRIGDLLDRLATLGHRDVLHVSGNYRHTSARSRRDEFIASARRLGLTYRVVDGDWTGDAGRSAVLDLPEDRGPTAVVAANDMVAAGAARGARERGWDVPGRLSVTGWDNHPLGEWLSPGLTSVAIDHVRLGRGAMHSLLAAVRKTEHIPDPEPITRIVWRESVGAPPW
ncbi:LacI family DNA-binding transcriptional regulator [Ruania halotolerans]|uniref:LacI family DNA-binding transcriptional regulator n=1 Tax=Ruania halotolerans TaxID=2897773 RepID=UPI001E2AC577|nr:LacI family DNA-binding transcriptional regulator [Ruania halotolerans]UFU06907.1 LacI family transcriptional regulator [Ruania halotolerans]